MNILHRCAAIASLVLAGCGSLSPAQMDQPRDPDAKVAELTAAWEQATSGTPSDTGSSEPAESLQVTEARLLEEAEVLALEYPRHVPTLVLCAALSYELRRREDAVVYLDFARSADSTSAEAAILRSRIALDEGNPQYAFRLLDEQANIHPDHPGVLEARAAAHFLGGRPFEALQDLSTAERLGAPSWRIAYNRGLVAEFQQQLDLAAAHYEACLKARPDWAPAQERLRGVNSSRGRP